MKPNPQLISTEIKFEDSAFLSPQPMSLSLSLVPNYPRFLEALSFCLSNLKTGGDGAQPIIYH